MYITSDCEVYCYATIIESNNYNAMLGIGITSEVPIILGNVLEKVFTEISWQESLYYKAPDKVRKINFNQLYLCYFFIKPYV